jgi:hypothetical protein
MAGMRGDDRQPDSMFSYVSAEQRVPTDHPLRAIRAPVDDVLREMSREFDRLYASIGWPSVPPEMTTDVPRTGTFDRGAWRNRYSASTQSSTAFVDCCEGSKHVKQARQG